GRLDGRVIAIDPGHGDDEADIDVHAALARALAAELARFGAKPEVFRDDADAPTPSSRAALANQMDATICVSLHLGTGVPASSGPTCSYFGPTMTHSPAGRHLAELILEELEQELRVRGRLQRLSVALLRETAMPAVQVEALAATNEVEAALLRTP